MTAEAPLWIEVAAALLLGLSGLLVIVSAIGFLRLPEFFLRMHPPALAYTLGTWCVTLAGTLYFFGRESPGPVHPVLIPILLSVTVPVTTLLLARVALFRRRVSGEADTPPPLTPPRSDTL
jgi:multicomponent K+:H+ antiporter subunit G